MKGAKYISGEKQKIRIVLAGLRDEDSIAELYCSKGIHQNLYYRWSRNFLQAGQKRLSGDTARKPLNIIFHTLKTKIGRLWILRNYDKLAA